MPPWPDGFARTAADRSALLTLTALHSVIPRRLFELAREEGSAAACREAILQGQAAGQADVQRMREASHQAVAEAVARCGARLVAPGDSEYPPALEDLEDPPAALFVRGRPLHDFTSRVSVVGARNCTPTGGDVARAIGAGLASAGITVVSGGARGIDTEAHRGALGTGGHTIAVLGCGIERAYPSSNRRLLERIETEGAVVSEYPPGVPPDPFRFPARNRIIAALSEAIVVVEGATGSGSMITADHALDLGRPIYAVPGAVNNPLAEVPLALIRDGATMIRNADDLLADLGHLDPDHEARSPSGLTVAEEAVFERLAGPTLAEHVAAELGWELSQAIGVLVALELRGLIRNVGGRFERRVGAAG